MKKTISAVVPAILALTSVLCGCSSNAESSSQSGSTTPATVATDTTVKTTGEKIHINDSTPVKSGLPSLTVYRKIHSTTITSPRRHFQILQ